MAEEKGERHIQENVPVSTSNVGMRSMTSDQRMEFDQRWSVEGLWMKGWRRRLPKPAPPESRSYISEKLQGQDECWSEGEEGRKGGRGKERGMRRTDREMTVSGTCRALGERGLRRIGIAGRRTRRLLRSAMNK
jgi:hypothetical protein